jgi:hypothetical protein
MLVSLFAFGLAFSANAGSVADADTDLVPDAFDNCSTRANGPGDASNQVDSNQDGYGNACDTDYTGDNVTSTADFPTFLGAFTGAAPDSSTDNTGDGVTSTADFPLFLSDFVAAAAPGPSGLSCAGTIPCLP